MKLNVKAFTFAIAIIWGVAILLYTWWIIILDGASSDPVWLGTIYRGFTITPLGSLIGLAWGFVDGLIGGFITAVLYNFLTDKCAETKGKSKPKAKKKK